jgi:hypothetical protein
MALVLSLHRQSRGVTSTKELPFLRWNPKGKTSPQALDLPLAPLPSLPTKPRRDTAIVSRTSATLR